jgi:hypothetical protein
MHMLRAMLKIRMSLYRSWLSPGLESNDPRWKSKWLRKTNINTSNHQHPHSEADRLNLRSLYLLKLWPVQDDWQASHEVVSFDVSSGTFEC